MSRSLQTVQDVVTWRMCLGCGACAYICPEQQIALIDYAREGIRPVLSSTQCDDCTKCLQVCPAVQSDFSPQLGQPKSPFSPAAFRKWGHMLAIYEGYATDPQIRFRSSSGGVLTALGLYCIEKLGMAGVLQTGADPENPILNRTRLSRTRKDLMNAMGSRYSPASVCNGLSLVEKAESPCVVVGKPSEISAVRNACSFVPALAKNVGLTMSFFCAETPSRVGTEALLARMGVRGDDLQELSYRGNGWPGHFAPVLKGGKAAPAQITYFESWAFLQKYRPWSVQLWPDGSGETADITCGDAWYEKPDGKNPGSSLVVVRSGRGMQIVQGAIIAGYLTLKPAEQWKLEQSQSGLLEKKGSVWGRRAMLRLMRLPVTRLRGAHLFRCWLGIPLREKVSSLYGTLRRVLQRGLSGPLRLENEPSINVPLPFDAVAQSNLLTRQQ